MQKEEKMGWFYKLLCSFSREDETSDWDPVGKYITAIFFKGQVALSKGPWVLDFTTPSRKSKGNQDGRARERGGKWGEKSSWGKGVTLGPCPNTSAQSREDLWYGSQWERSFSSLLSSHKDLTAWTTIWVEHFCNTVYQLAALDRELLCCQMT